jgi:hypothetical protein
MAITLSRSMHVPGSIDSCWLTTSPGAHGWKLQKLWSCILRSRSWLRWLVMVGISTKCGPLQWDPDPALGECSWFELPQCVITMRLRLCLYVQCAGSGGVPNKVVTRMIEDERTDGWTMAAGSSVIWTHCNIRYKVTLGVNRRVRADGQHPRHGCQGIWKDYIRGPQTFHSHFLHRLGLEKLRCVWCTLWSRLR